MIPLKYLSKFNNDVSLFQSYYNNITLLSIDMIETRQVPTSNLFILFFNFSHK